MGQWDKRFWTVGHYGLSTTAGQFFEKLKKGGVSSAAIPCTKCAPYPASCLKIPDYIDLLPRHSAPITKMTENENMLGFPRLVSDINHGDTIGHVRRIVLIRSPCYHVTFRVLSSWKLPGSILLEPLPFYKP